MSDETANRIRDGLQSLEADSAALAELRKVLDKYRGPSRSQRPPANETDIEVVQRLAKAFGTIAAVLAPALLYSGSEDPVMMAMAAAERLTWERSQGRHVRERDHGDGAALAELRKLLDKHRMAKGPCKNGDFITQDQMETDAEVIDRLAFGAEGARKADERIDTFRTLLDGEGTVVVHGTLEWRLNNLLIEHKKRIARDLVIGTPGSQRGPASEPLVDPSRVIGRDYLTAVVALLRRLRWEDIGRSCSGCAREWGSGCAPGCELARLLREGEAMLGKKTP